LLWNFRIESREDLEALRANQPRRSHAPIEVLRETFAVLPIKVTECRE
jgi:hypothetical protein